MGRVAAVVLAAGEATRFGAPKQRLLLPAVLERLSRAPVDEIVVVQGAHELEAPSYKLLQGLPVRVVECAEWSRGPGASLRCGLHALGEDVDAAVVVLADGPELAPEAVVRVLDAWREAGRRDRARRTEERAGIPSSSAAPTGRTSRTTGSATAPCASSRATTSAHRVTSTLRRTSRRVSKSRRRSRGAARASP